MREPRPADGAARAALTGSITLVGLTVLALALTTSSRAVPGPGRWTVADVARWCRDQPVGATFRLLAALGLPVVAHLALATIASTVAAVARAARLPRLAALADAVATPVLHRIVVGALGVGLIASGTAPAHGASDGRATMRELPPTDDAPRPPVEPLVVAEVAEVAQAGRGPWPATWTIEPGDHLWGRSARLLAATSHREPTETEIAALVERVVDLNRDRLVVRGQPDLVFPGQVFDVPTPD